MEKIITKCAIIGGGPAGYTAAIYASRSGLNPIVFLGMQPGGQLTTTSEVDEFPPGTPKGCRAPNSWRRSECRPHVSEPTSVRGW